MMGKFVFLMKENWVFCNLLFRRQPQQHDWKIYRQNNCIDTVCFGYIRKWQEEGEMSLQCDKSTVKHKFFGEKNKIYFQIRMVFYASILAILSTHYLYSLYIFTSPLHSKLGERIDYVLDISLTEESRLLLHVIHRPFYWWIFTKNHTGFKNLTANAPVATVLGSIPAFVGTVESEGRQLKQCWIQYEKNIKKSPPQKKKKNPYQNKFAK